MAKTIICLGQESQSTDGRIPVNEKPPSSEAVRTSIGETSSASSISSAEDVCLSTEEVSPSSVTQAVRNDAGEVSSCTSTESICPAAKEVPLASKPEETPPVSKTGDVSSDSSSAKPYPVGESCSTAFSWLDTDDPASTVLVYQSELDYISRCIMDCPNIETGGQLFGFWTVTGIPVVLFAIGPGPKANHSHAFFNQDVDYLLKVGNHLISKYGLQHIGEWHSHHKLGLARPSSHDASTMVNCIRKQNLGRFLLCIGNCSDYSSTLNAFNFSQKAGYDYKHADWEVKNGTSPFRTAIAQDKLFCGLLIDPCTKNAAWGSEAPSCSPSYENGYWLMDKTNNFVLKRIIDRLASESINGNCSVQIDQYKIVHLSFLTEDGKLRIVFPIGFPNKPPEIMHDGKELESVNARWISTGDIYSDFFNYFDALH